MTQSSIAAASKRGAAFEVRVLEMLEGSPIGELPSQELACDFIRLSLHHFRALHAIALEHPFSALALFRPQVEAYARGLWILSQGDTIAQQVMKDLAEGEVEYHIPKRIESLLSEASANKEYSPLAGPVALYWNEFGSALHGYTHGGRISVQLVAEGVEEERILDLMKHSRAFAGFALLLLLNAADVSEQVSQKVHAAIQRVLDE